MKRKESNHRRYIILCDEGVKKSSHSDSTQFGDEYIINRHLKLMYKGEEYNAYNTFNTNSDKFELFILHGPVRMHKTSLVEGNFDRVLDHPELVIALALDVMERYNRMKEKENE